MEKGGKRHFIVVTQPKLGIALEEVGGVEFARSCTLRIVDQLLFANPLSCAAFGNSSSPAGARTHARARGDTPYC